MKKCLCIVLVCFLSLPLWTSGQDAQNTPKEQQSKARTFLQVLFQITGISATPRQLKGPEEDMENSNIWLANVAQKTRRQITEDGGYRSPVFLPGDQEILALQEDVLVRIPVSNGEPQELYPIARVVKLVGFDQEDQDKLLILSEDQDGRMNVGLLSLQSGQITFLPYDEESDQHQDMLNHLQDWERVYDDTTLYVKYETKQDIFGQIEWSDVYLKQGDQNPVNLSQCDGINCGQPSRSHDGQQVVFVKMED